MCLEDNIIKLLEVKMKLKKLLIIIFIIVFNSISNIYAQSSYSNVPYKIIVGHLNGMSGAYKSYELLLSQSNSELPYDVVVEHGVGYCYFLNLYVSQRDTNCLSNINISNKDEKQFYKYIYNLNKNRESNNKIKIKSIDLEHEDNFKASLNAVFYMIKLVSNSNYQNIANNIYNNPNKVNHIKTKDLLRLIDSTRMSYLMIDDSVLTLIRKNIYETTNLGIPNSRSFKKAREKILLEHFNKATYLSNQYLYIADVSHLPTKKFGKPFLKKANLQELGIECLYPVYFNHNINFIYKKSFYCVHPKNPFRRNKTLGITLNSKKGSWLLSVDKVRYLVVSN